MKRRHFVDAQRIIAFAKRGDNVEWIAGALAATRAEVRKVLKMAGIKPLERVKDNPSPRVRYHVFAKYKNEPWARMVSNEPNRATAVKIARYYVKIGRGRVRAKVMKG